MKNNLYNGTTLPKVNTQTSSIPTKETPGFDVVTITPVLGDNIVKLGKTNISHIEVRAIASNMSIGTATKSSLRIVQGSTKITGGAGVSFTPSSNAINTGNNIAKVSKFRNNGVIFNFSAVSGSLTLQIASF